MCVPRCQEALQAALSRRGFFKGAAAAGLAATVIEPAEAAKKKAAKQAEPAAGARAPEGQGYFKGVVDLTHTMSPDFPTFFGVPGIELQKQYDFKKDGFNLNWWKLLEHAGTHLDAPIASAVANSWCRLPSSMCASRPRRTRIISWASRTC